MYYNPLPAFRDGFYLCFARAKNALMDTADALLSEPSARSLPELSLSPFFGRTWHSLYEALASLDGLASRCSGSPEVPRWIGQRFVEETKPQKQADTDAAKLLSSSGAVVIASEEETKTAWVKTGQVYERLALKMTSLNIKSAFLNGAIEVPQVRGQFQSALSLGKTLPQLLVRFGYAAPMPTSLRRPVEQVLV